VVAPNAQRTAVRPSQSSQAAAQYHDSQAADAGPPATLPHPGPVRVAIAMLLDGEISAMTRDDLVDLIHLSSLPFLSEDVCRRLKFLGDETLSRLGYLVRRCCRGQLDAHRRQCGERMLWCEAL
jgi:hypothetical protein